MRAIAEAHVSALMSRKWLHEVDSSKAVPRSSGFRAKAVGATLHGLHRWHREDAICQDCLRACRALIVLVRATNQNREQLNTVSNFPRDHSASSLVAACNISCQGDDRTARAWLIAVRLVQVIIEGDEISAR